MKTIHRIISFVDRHVEMIVIVLAVIGLVKACSWACFGIRWVESLF